MSARHVVVDGSNIATEGRSLPSLQQLDEAVRAFLSEHPHDLCTVVVDATFEHRIDSSEKQMYDEALAANELLTPPAGSIGRGDKFILEIADRVDATVFSNDSFQEFHGEYEWLFDEGRLIGGKPVPGVGWVFVARTPVRGPKSRLATRAASRKKARAGAGSSVKKAKRTGPTSSGAELGPMPKPKGPPPKGSVAKEAKKEPSPKAPAAKAPSSRSKKAGAGGGAAPSTEPINAPLPFIEFVADHQVGSEVEAEVVEFSSHGAYVMVGDVRCYAPLKLLGDPAPRSAREALTRGETRTFVVHAIHAARRGIDVALADVPAARVVAAPKTVTEAPSGADIGADQAPGEPGAQLPESEATLAPTKKAATRRSTAKKAPAKKSTAARKATAAKKTVKKAPAKKTTARKTAAKKTTARKSAAKKTTAKKTAAKKTTARKSAAKKTTAKKTAAKKTTARKSAAKKTTARKSAAKKTTARKSAAKKTTAKKTAAKKTTARKSAAKKTTARKTAAKKTTARKSPARKTAARKAPARRR
jgi:chemotaxis protein histidine kinase CheA